MPAYLREYAPQKGFSPDCTRMVIVNAPWLRVNGSWSPEKIRQLAEWFDFASHKEAALILMIYGSLAATINPYDFYRAWEEWALLSGYKLCMGPNGNDPAAKVIRVHACVALGDELTSAAHPGFMQKLGTVEGPWCPSGLIDLFRQHRITPLPGIDEVVFITEGGARGFAAV